MKRINGNRCARMIAGLLTIILLFSLILPSYVQAASDESILEGNEEQVFSEETSDELILEQNEEQVFSEEPSDESRMMDEQQKSDTSVSEEMQFTTSEANVFISEENEIQVFSEEPSEEPGMIGKQQRSGISVLAKMKPSTSEAIYTGNSGYFNLEVGVNDPNQNGTATVHVYIKDPNAILPQFENTIGKYIMTDKGHVITLMEDPEKGRYLEIANVKNGDTVTQGIEIKYANGITAPTTLTVTQDDIEVILNGIDEANIVKEGGKLQFISTFYWKDVAKTANTAKPISIDENGKITGGPINYTISANSYNNTGHGDVYSKCYSLIDTLTLPAGLTFPSGESVDIEEGSGDIWYLTTEIDGVSVRLATLSMEEMDGLEEMALTIQILEKDEKTLKLKIQVEQFSGDTHVLPSPKITMNLDVTKLTASEEFIENLGGQTAPEIDNQVEFEAVPVTKYHPSTLNNNQLQIDTSVIKADSFTSSADAKVPVSAPQSSFEVSKSVAEGDVIRDPQTGKTTIYYTLKVRNTGTRTVTLDIVDTLPQGMHFAEDEKLEGTVTGRSEKLTGTKNGGDTGSQTAAWAAVRIPKNGEFTARIAAVVDDDTPDGILKNTLTVTETGTENSQKKEHSYDYKKPKRDFSVDKSHRVHSGQEGLYKGGTITYQVVVENTGDFELVLSSVTDQFPEGLLIDRDSFTLNGEKVSEGVSIDETQKQISLPVTNAIKTLDPGEKVIYTYDAMLAEDSNVALNEVLTNTVQAVDENGNQKTTADTVTVREKKANLKIEKSAGNPVFVPGTDGTYAIEYTVTVRNEGDAVTEPIELTDHMSGALYPERDESDDFTIAVEKSAYQKHASEGEKNFIMTDGGFLKESEGKVSIDRTGEGATLKWSVNDMPGYEPGKQYAPVFTYTYTAYADMKGDSPVHVSNAILAPKGSGAEVIGTGPSTDLTPVPQIEKIISRIDCAYGGIGNAPSHTVNGQSSNKTGKIHSGDKVTYTMTFKNEGTTEMIGALITDNLPSGFTDSGSDPFQWKLQDGNVDISEGYIGGVSITAEGFSQGTTLDYALKQGNTNTQLIISDSKADAQKDQPNGFIFPAGAVITLTVTLQFPAGETYDRHFLNGEYEAPQTPFPNTVSLKGADRRGETYHLTDHADVYPQATQARISKSADKTLLYPGDEVTFTIRPADGNEQFFTTQAMTDVQIVEDLSRFTDFELVSYKIGYIDAYGIPSGSSRPNGNQFTFTLLDETKKTVPFAKENASTVVLDQPIDIGSAQNKKIVWNLGDVRGAWVSNAGAGLEKNWPQITLRVKDDAGIQRVTNTVQLEYNGGRSERKQVDVSVGSTDLLQKIAERTVKNPDETYSYYSIQNENEGEHLKPGDLVTFTLTYTNGTGMTQSFSGTAPLILTDVMTTLGLEPYTSEVELRYVSAEESATAEDAPVLLEPSQMEVTQADIESTSSKRTEFKIKGTLKPADKIQIRYMVKVGDGFANSESENADGSKNNYIQDAQTPQNVSKNLHQLHNLVYYEDESGVPVVGQTDYYYAPTENRLYFSKAVQEVTEITLNSANNFSLDASKHSDDLFVLNSEGQNFVKYVIVIANDPSSGEELVIDNVTDQLPDGVLPLKNNSGKDQWAIVGALCNNNQYNGSAFSSGYSGSISIGGANLSNAPFTTGYFGALLQAEKYQEAGYKPVENNVTATSQSEDAITFSIRSRSNGSNLRLKPGEFTAIAYGVYLDRSTYRRSYTNSATLNVKQTEDGTGWTALNGELQKTFVAKQKFQKAWDEQNVDTGKPINAMGTSFGASVSLIPSQYRLSMTKKASAYYRVDKTKLGDAEFRKEFLMNRGRDAGTAGSTDWSAYDISDIVEWKITITNKSSAAIDDFVVTDYVPYPHKIIYYTENGKEYAGVSDLPGESKAVHPAELTRSDLTESLESMGKTYRTLKSDPFRLKAGETATFYVYSYYSPTAPIVYSTVTNRAEATTASGKVFNTIDDANPVYDAEGIRIIGGTQSASVNAAYSASVSSVKSIAFEDQTAFGSSSENRTVTANARGDKVRYTLSVTNDDDAHDMRRLTLIDNLPMPGDYGVINLSTPRESAFTVDLAKEANLEVKVNDRILTPIAGEVYNSNDFSLDQLDREEYADKYLLLYTTHGRHTGGDIEDVWHIDRDDIQEHWFTSPPKDGRVTSILFYIPSAMKAGATLQISFDAVIGEDAQKDAVAWNSFGFRYHQSGANQNFNSTDPMIYAEPSKVGVTIGTYYETPKLSISKEVQGEYGDKTKSFTFTITGRQKDGAPLSGDYSYTGSVLDDLGAAVEVPADGTLHFENGTAEISLRHGQQITIENIPYGCICKVTESQENGYTATYNGKAECGEVELKGPVSIHVVNTSNMLPATGLFSSHKSTDMALLFGIAGLGILAFGIWCRRRKYKI